MNHALIFSINNNNLYRNFGAHKIASWLRSHGWDIEVIDYSSYFTLPELQELCRSRITSHTKFIGFSDTWGIHGDLVLQEKYHHLQQFLRINYPEIKFIVGSQEISFTSLTADYYVQGFAENAMLEIVKHILGTNSTRLKFTLYRNGKLVMGSDYSSIYATEPITKFQARDFIDHREQLGIEMSRGCKFECDFCTYNPLGLRTDNFRAVNDYINNLKYLNDELGITSFYLSDSTANVSNEKLQLFGDATTKLNFKPWICGFIRADLLTAHPQSWDSLIAMGVFGHSYGIETFNHASAKAIGKGMHPDKIKSGLLDIRKYFNAHGTYRNTISLIAGLPYESWQEHLLGIKWIYENLPESSIGLNPLYIPKNLNDAATKHSLFTDSYSKFGYIDTEPTSKEFFLSWYNTNTNESFNGIVDKFNESDYARETYYTPWTIGTLRMFKNYSLEQALNDKVQYSTGMDTGLPFRSNDTERVIFVNHYIYRKLSQ